MKNFIFDFGALNYEYMMSTFVEFNLSMIEIFWISELPMNTRYLTRQNIAFNLNMLTVIRISQPSTITGCVWSHCLVIGSTLPKSMFAFVLLNFLYTKDLK